MLHSGTTVLPVKQLSEISLAIKKPTHTFKYSFIIYLENTSTVIYILLYK